MNSRMEQNTFRCRFCCITAAVALPARPQPAAAGGSSVSLGLVGEQARPTRPAAHPQPPPHAAGRRHPRAATTASSGGSAGRVTTTTL